MGSNNTDLWIGMDVGSTTVKIAVVDPQTGKLLHNSYQRHNAMQAEKVMELLKEAHAMFPGKKFGVAFCGSGGQPFAEATHAFFVQEVVANALAVRSLHPETRVAIELGGQDAKVIFFEKDRTTGKLIASDMRMNGVCAGGTGAFIDQVAELLRIKTEQFESYASQGKKVYEISGRCGVFAKTDIQPMLNQGIAKEDIALSSFHAIAKQTIGGLAQGMEIKPPVMFEGGPLTFNPTLVRVFKERLGISDEQAIIPEHSEIFVALGAALSLGSMFNEKESHYDESASLDALAHFNATRQAERGNDGEPFFKNEAELAAFKKRHPLASPHYPQPVSGSVVNAYLGIDAGSTTTKMVLLDENEQVIDGFYAGNDGEPLAVLKRALVSLADRYEEFGCKLNILGVGTTGYGEQLFAKAIKADYHTVETVAHANAAQYLHSDVSFILDIGGQDMKAISIQDGVVTGIILNEACSSGCGSFIETYARSLGIPMEQIAELAFNAKSPSKLGSRCTVFMNSSIITEQRDGKQPEDIIAGICRSIIENVFTKVIRIRNLETLGKVVVVQGGTFKNDAVLRAFEQLTGFTPIRPERPGEMGAIGIALLTKRHMESKRAENPETPSSFVGLEAMRTFSWDNKPGQICKYCTNHCSRTIVTFSDGSSFVTGNRCERGEVTADPNDPETKKIVAEIHKKMLAVPDMIKRTNQLLVKDYGPAPLVPQSGKTIGIPRVLEFWVSLPYWKAFFTSLGYNVVISKISDYPLFEKGLHSVPSDTVCFPAKLVHGHVLDLIEKKVDRIFFPCMIAVPSDHSKFQATAVCPVVQGYPNVCKNTDDPEGRYHTPLDQPTFHWFDTKLRRSQTIDWFHENWKLSKKLLDKAVTEGEKALQTYRDTLLAEGGQILEDTRKKGQFAVVIAGRPYHADTLVNHNVATHFTSMGIPVLTTESLPGVYDQDVPKVTRIELKNTFHLRMLGATMIAANDPAIELVQIVSFGCGHDSILTDEMNRILHLSSSKELLMLKLDEGDARGPVGIRVKSFIETVRARRAAKFPPKAPSNEPLFTAPFTKEDKAKRTILIPNLSPGFGPLAASYFDLLGYKTVTLPMANARAIELGKKYVHNDICFPGQVNIGENLLWLEEHPEVLQTNIAIGLAKNCENCRAVQYATLARKALDEAGFTDVSIITTGSDTKYMHPGFKLGLDFQLHMLWGIAVMDSVETMYRACRPYELQKGDTQKVYDKWLPRLMHTIGKTSKISIAYPRQVLHMFDECIAEFNAIPVDRTVRKPRVSVLGEILMNYHPSANGYIEEYLMNNGMEVVLPGMMDFFRVDEVVRNEKISRGLIQNPLLNRVVGNITASIYTFAVKTVGKKLKQFKWYEHHADCYELVHLIGDIIDPSYNTGEGWLIPGEILYNAAQGVNSFVILQPFACLANHISGRGLTKAVKAKFPHIQVLSLDYDPDTSFANIENRLQMLIINAKELEKANTSKES
ncbi:MAG: acyl-CoA dehydratase activase [Fibrobacter sp.]|jgi:predicted CoA-substrate-specific enzyme activase|nr:acyl-CoA dehydratase activase [Fibrobacter sp.]